MLLLAVAITKPGQYCPESLVYTLVRRPQTKLDLLGGGEFEIREYQVLTC